MIERIEINLLPAEYRVHRKSIRLEKEVTIPALLVTFLACILWWMSVMQNNEIVQVQQSISRIDTEIQKNRPIKTEIERLRTDRRIIEQKIVALERINVDRAKWVHLLEIFCKEIPKYSWLISLDDKSTQNPPVIIIKGNTYSFTEVASFMTGLAQTDYISAVDLTSIEQQKPGESGKFYTFSLTGTVNQNAGITLPDSLLELGQGHSR